MEQSKNGRMIHRICLWAAGILTGMNLIMTASLVSLLAAILILVMIWGIHRGDYSLTTALAVVLLLYGTLNLIVLATVLLSGQEARLSALIWLGGYSAAVLALGVLLRMKPVRDYCKSAVPPDKKPSRFHFFRGGWRDL